MSGNRVSRRGILEHVGALVSDPEGIVVCERGGERRVIPFGEIRRAEAWRELVSSCVFAAIGAGLGCFFGGRRGAVIGAILGGMVGKRLAGDANEWCRRRPCACYGW